MTELAARVLLGAVAGGCTWAMTGDFKLASMAAIVVGMLATVRR